MELTRLFPLVAGTGTGKSTGRISAMTVHQLHEMLGDLDDTQEIVFDAPHADDGESDDPLVLAWRGAARRAAQALSAWRIGGGREAYSRYRALADQADAAQDALEASALRAPRTA